MKSGPLRDGSRLGQRGIVTFAVAAALLCARAPILHAEQPSTTLQLHLRPSHRPLVHPSPDLAIAQRDAQQAMADLEVRERRAKAMREAVPRLPHRPDLTYDVVSRVQARRLNDTLR